MRRLPHPLTSDERDVQITNSSGIAVGRARPSSLYVLPLFNFPFLGSVCFLLLLFVVYLFCLELGPITALLLAYLACKNEPSFIMPRMYLSWFQHGVAHFDKRDWSVFVLIVSRSVSGTSVGEVVMGCGLGVRGLVPVIGTSRSNRLWVLPGSVPSGGVGGFPLGVKRLECDDDVHLLSGAKV